DSASTRAMTRRCSVMRMPVAAQRASMPVFFIADGDFSGAMSLQPWTAGRHCSATACMLRQVTAHQKRIQMFPTGLLVIALAAPDAGKAGPSIEPSGRLVVFLHFQENSAHATAGKMAEMRQQQVARQAAAALAGIDRDRQDFGFIRSHPRY